MGIKLDTLIGQCALAQKIVDRLVQAHSNSLMKPIAVFPFEMEVFNDIDGLREAMRLTDYTGGIAAIQEGDTAYILRVNATVGSREFEATFDNRYVCVEADQDKQFDHTDQLAEIQKVVESWIEDPERAAPYESSAMPMLAQRCFTASSIARRLSRAAAFRKGGSDAIRTALEIACTRGFIRELTHSQKMDLFGESGKKIYQLI